MFFLLIILLIIMITINNVYGINNILYVYIDPGHGGLDPGTVVEGIKEKDINLNVSLALEKYLKKKNVKVSLTRNKDYDLSSPNATFRKKSDFDNRIILINKSNADLFVSIHTNYLENPKYNGIMIYSTEKNIKIANYFQLNLNKKRTAKIINNSLYLYRHITIPGVLIEIGFLSNEEERKNLLDDNYIDALANRISDCIVNYYLNGV